MWTNTATFQNSFDIRGSIYGDFVHAFGGVVSGSVFGDKAGQPGYDEEGRYDGRFTKIFLNLGAGDDSYAAHGFRAAGRVWGGTGDDFIDAGLGNDRLFGDNGSGANFNPDPASPVALVDDDFINEPITGASVPTFNNGLGPINLGPLVDMGAYTIAATGGDLVQLKTGLPATRAGGLGIRSADDPIGSLADIEIDRRGAAEAITVDFKHGAHSVELDLTALFTESVPAARGLAGHHSRDGHL